MASERVRSQARPGRQRERQLTVSCRLFNHLICAIKDTSIDLSIPANDFAEQLMNRICHATAKALRWWLTHEARDRLIEERPELTTVQFLDGDVRWYPSDAVISEPLLR
jgi:hypothetical protein